MSAEAEHEGKSDGTGTGVAASRAGTGDVIEEGNFAEQDRGATDDGEDLDEATEEASNGNVGNENEGAAKTPTRYAAAAAAAESTRLAGEDDVAEQDGGAKDDGEELLGEVTECTEEASNGDVRNENDVTAMTPTRYAAAAAAAASSRLAAAAAASRGGAISFPRGAYRVAGPGIRGDDDDDEEANSGAATPGESGDRSTPPSSNGNDPERGNNPRQSTVLSALVDVSERAGDPTAVEATRVEHETVYDAVHVPTRQVSAPLDDELNPIVANQRCMYRRAVLLAGAAAVVLAVGLLLGLNNSGSEEGNELAGSGRVSSTQLSQSAHPSPNPSYHPTPQPSSAPSSYWSTFKLEQLGETFIGDVARDEFGKSVSLSADASILAIGAPLNDETGTSSGQVKVYIWDESVQGYKERQSVYGRETDREFFGASLSLSADGKSLAVGAWGADFKGSWSGEVKMYVWDEATSEYNELQSIYGDAAADQLGASVAVSGDGLTVAVGAPQPEAGRGYVTMYVWNDAASNYVQRGDIIYGDSDLAVFGHHVSLSADGEIMIVSAPNRSGQVKVYVRDKATEGYVELQSFYGEEPDSLLGSALTLTPDKRTLAVAAPGQDLVQVYEWDDASSTYKDLHTIYGEELFPTTSTMTSERIGIGLSALSMSADGKTLAVGSARHGVNENDSGQVKVFVWDDASSEYQQIGDALDGEASGDLFGFSVALSEDGQTLAIGATQRFEIYEAGQVKVFHVEHEDEL